jgi:hypothetical protein
MVSSADLVPEPFRGLTDRRVRRNAWALPRLYSHTWSVNDMSSNGTIRDILNEGRVVDSQLYRDHCGINHVKTFYFFCERLSQEPTNVAVSSTELKAYILAQLRNLKIDVSNSFNPEGWFGKAWTDRTDASKDEKHFRSEYRYVLLRTGNGPYSYQIRPEYLPDVREFFADSEDD